MSNRYIIKDSIMGWSAVCDCGIPDDTHLLFDVFDRSFNDGFYKRFDDELDVFEIRFNNGFDIRVNDGFDIRVNDGFDEKNQ